MARAGNQNHEPIAAAQGVSPVLRGLLGACRANPEDDGARLILADWLEEHADPRGEFVRIQIERSQLPDWDSRQGALARREAALLRLHHAEWLGGLAPRSAGADFRRGF